MWHLQVQDSASSLLGGNRRSSERLAGEPRKEVRCCLCDRVGSRRLLSGAGKGLSYGFLGVVVELVQHSTSTRSKVGKQIQKKDLSLRKEKMNE